MTLKFIYIFSNFYLVEREAVKDAGSAAEAIKDRDDGSYLFLIAAVICCHFSVLSLIFESHDHVGTQLITFMNFWPKNNNKMNKDDIYKIFSNNSLKLPLLFVVPMVVSAQWMIAIVFFDSGFIQRSLNRL